MKRLEKEIRDGLCKLYCFDCDGALDAGVIETEMQIQNLLSVIQPSVVKQGDAKPGAVRHSMAQFCTAM